METVTDIKKMQRKAEGLRSRGQIIALVPTMGYLHEGHLSLMREARKRADVLTISIFVNPTQFGPGEDYEAYPRDMEKDLTMAKDVGVDIVFNPTAQAMYPPRHQTHVEVEKVTKNLCGISRPLHFRGVTTVVAKLFNIVKPHLAFFGQKDYQQLIAIQRMVADLNMDIEVIGLPTVREPDGLAMSSRNAYLNPDERNAAQSLYRSLIKAEELVRQGVTNTDSIINAIRNTIEAEDLAQIDYANICHSQTLEDINEITDQAVVALAVRIGRARLIDNIILRED